LWALGNDLGVDLRHAAKTSPLLGAGPLLGALLGPLLGPLLGGGGLFDTPALVKRSFFVVSKDRGVTSEGGWTNPAREVTLRRPRTVKDKI